MLVLPFLLCSFNKCVQLQPVSLCMFVIKPSSHAVSVQRLRVSKPSWKCSSYPLTNFFCQQLFHLSVCCGFVGMQQFLGAHSCQVALRVPCTAMWPGLLSWEAKWRHFTTPESDVGAQFYAFDCLVSGQVFPVTIIRSRFCGALLQLVAVAAFLPLWERIALGMMEVLCFLLK